jgi:hypothetical protein
LSEVLASVFRLYTSLACTHLYSTGAAVRASLLPSSHFASHHQPAHVAAATVLLQRCMHHQHLGSSGISLPANIVQ